MFQLVGNFFRALRGTSGRSQRPTVPLTGLAWEQSEHPVLTTDDQVRDYLRPHYTLEYINLVLEFAPPPYAVLVAIYANRTQLYGTRVDDLNDIYGMRRRADNSETAMFETKLANFRNATGIVLQGIAIRSLDDFDGVLIRVCRVMTAQEFATTQRVG